MSIDSASQLQNDLSSSQVVSLSMDKSTDLDKIARPEVVA